MPIYWNIPRGLQGSLGYTGQYKVRYLPPRCPSHFRPWPLALEWSPQEETLTNHGIFVSFFNKTSKLVIKRSDLLQSKYFQTTLSRFCVVAISKTHGFPLVSHTPQRQDGCTNTTTRSRSIQLLSPDETIDNGTSTKTTLIRGNPPCTNDTRHSCVYRIL